jgi:hypothetical protein
MERDARTTGGRREPVSKGDHRCDEGVDEHDKGSVQHECNKHFVSFPAAGWRRVR